MAKQHDDDDGRVIFDMSGLNDISKPSLENLGEARKKPNKSERRQRPYVEMSNSDARKAAFSATLAALLVAGVFIVGIGLFILFCVYVWFR